MMMRIQMMQNVVNLCMGKAAEPGEVQRLTGHQQEVVLLGGPVRHPYQILAAEG